MDKNMKYWLWIQQVNICEEQLFRVNLQNQLFLGQDEYSIFPTQYTVDIDGYVLVYSIDNEKSFEVVQAIYEKLVDLLGNPSFPLVLVGNKSDLHMNRVVSQATGKKLAQDLKAIFFETSAKENHCANDLFTKAIIQIEKVS